MEGVVVEEVAGEIYQPPKPEKLSIFQTFSNLPEPKEWLQQQKNNVRPWTLFLSTSNFRAPPSLPRLFKRVTRNIEYFQSNYLFVFLGLVVYCLITSPLVLMAIALTLYVSYKLNKRHQEKKLVIFGRELSLGEQYGLVMLCSFPLYYMVGAHAAMFWVIGASCVVIALHASFYNIDAVTRSEDEAPFLAEV